MVIKVSPQQGLNAALAQYAPGHKVWIDGKEHLSLGIWSAFDPQRWKAWDERSLYFHCQICDYATLEDRKSGVVGQTKDCPACNARGGMGPAQQWLRPVGFSHPPSVLATPPRIEGTVNSRPTRAKLDTPYFAENLRVGGSSWPIGSGWEAWQDSQELVVTNRGTESSQRQGFRHCVLCGRTEPADFDPALQQLGAADHERPRPRKAKEPDRCSGRATTVVLGNRFRTDIAVFRLQTPPQWTLAPDRPATVIAARSAVEALIRAASQDLEPGDIDGDYRFAPGKGGAGVLDLYLYDQAAGGAGFVKAAAADPDKLFRAALAVLDDCTCEDSCYQCLRSYRNRFDHASLDRRLGADLLQACFLGFAPELDNAWARAALTRLCRDMNDSGGDFALREGGLISGDQGVVLAHPFRPNAPGNAEATSFAGTVQAVRAVDILLVERALPIATAQALDRTVKPSRALLPSATGAPLLTMAQAIAGEGLASATRVAAGPFEPDDFVVKLDADTLDGPLGDGKAKVTRGTPCLFRPWTGGIADPRRVYLLHRTDGGAFGATRQEWTVGMLQPTAAGSKVRYRAATHRTECAPETVAPGDAVTVVASFVRQVA